MRVSLGLMPKLESLPEHSNVEDDSRNAVPSMDGNSNCRLQLGAVNFLDAAVLMRLNVGALPCRWRLTY